MKKHVFWAIPFILFLALVSAMVFRWDYAATKSGDGLYVAKWKIDRWTGQKWVERYGPTTMDEVPLKTSNRERAWSKRNVYTNIWKWLVVGAVIWLIPSIFISRIKEEDADTKQINRRC